MCVARGCCGGGGGGEGLKSHTVFSAFRNVFLFFFCQRFGCSVVHQAKNPFYPFYFDLSPAPGANWYLVLYMDAFHQLESVSGMCCVCVCVCVFVSSCSLL